MRADLRYSEYDVGHPKTKKVLIVANLNADYVDEKGFIIQAGSSGDIVYTPLDQKDSLTETFAVGGYPNVCGLPVVCKSITVTGTTVTSIIVGTK